MQIFAALGHALSIAAAMAWEILWALILGFLLSAIVESVVRKGTIGRLLGTDRPKSLAIATGLGAASSSCSYAAVALARSLFRNGSDFTAAMAFEIASTNLVIELGVLLALLLGWQFTLAEFIGGPVMIILLAILFRLFLRTRILEGARAQADRGLSGKMEGHAAMDMSIPAEGSLWHRMLSPAGRTSISQYFVMNWASVWIDIVGGLFLAGAAAAWIPDSFWQSLFLVDHPTLAKLWGPLIGPLVAVISFVCSIGNVPLAAVLWNGGISFGGVISFIFADLIVIPVLIIYRKYYGTKMTLFIFVTFYATMVVAGYFIEILFGATGLTPTERNAQVIEAHFSWNYTTYLNLAFLVVAAALVTRFVRTGGVPMLKMMKASSEEAGGGHRHES